MRRLRRLGRDYPELLSVAVATVVGLTARTPMRWLTDRQGINVLLAVLVLATALTVSPRDLGESARAWRRLLVTVGATAVALPVLSWAASRIVAAGTLRDGICAVGLAPCEIASVATTAMAGGATGFAAGVLVGSTLTGVALAGPVLAVEAGSGDVHPGRVVVNLVLVVAIPLAVGLALRARAPRLERAARAFELTALVTVACLVALIAGEVQLGVRYLSVVLALVVFIIVSALVGRLLGSGSTTPVGRAVLLTTSMRDFAIAAGLASAAFGPASAAPLGVYGILVLLWGTGAAGALRRAGVLRADP